MRRNIALAVVALSVLCSLPVHADQSTFTNVGRTNQVSTERRQYGDIKTRIDLNTIQPDGSRLYDATVSFLPNGDQITVLTTHVQTGTSPLHTTSASCDGDSYDTSCYGIKAIASCTWSALATNAKTALTLLLGSCTKQCITATGTYPWGETYTTYGWTCVTPNTANCVMTAGNDGRVDLIEQTSGCQF